MDNVIKLNTPDTFAVAVPLTLEDLTFLKKATRYLHLIEDLTLEEHQRLERLINKLDLYWTRLLDREYLNQQTKVSKCKHKDDAGQTKWAYVRLNQILHEWLCNDCGGIAWTESEERLPKAKDIIL